MWRRLSGTHLVCDQGVIFMLPPPHYAPRAFENICGSNLLAVPQQRDLYDTIGYPLMLGTSSKVVLT